MVNYRRLKKYIQSDVLIYRYFFGDFEVNQVYSSPLRKDYNPSFSIRQSQKGNLYWVDYGLADQEYFDGVGLVMAMYNITRQEAIQAIWSHLVRKEKYKIVRNTKPKVKKKVPYEFLHSSLRPWELKYWEEHLVNEQLLNIYNVHSLNELTRDDKLVMESVKGNPAYIYLWEENEEAFKSYRPLDKFNDKFRGQQNGMWIQGFENLPKQGRDVIIQSSMKDVLVLTSARYNTAAPQSENSHRALLDKARELNNRFDRVHILFDADSPGIKAAKVLNQKVGGNWNILNWPRAWSKDPSDLVHKERNHYLLNAFMRKNGIYKH